MTKLLENIHRAVNIGLVNEMKIVAGTAWASISSKSSTRPQPSHLVSRHIIRARDWVVRIPIDPFYLTWKAREYGLHTRFIELAGEVNRAMPEYVLSKLVDGLNEHGKAVKGAKVMVMGIAYKKNVDDTRELPSVLLMEMLRDRGADLSYADPHVPVFPKMREHRFDLSATPLTPDTLRAQDAVLLATDHAAFDYELIKEHARLIIDARGVYRDPAKNIVRA